jgi:hypothetical protein
MPATYEPIATTTLGSAQATVTLSSIPATYTDLILVFRFDKSAADTGSRFTVNNDTGSNYSTTDVRGNGTAASSGRDSTQTFGRYFRGLANTAADNIVIMQFMNYSNTTTYKTILTRANNANGTEANVNLWQSTSAINRIDIITASGTYSAGSTFTLYGIKAA